MAFLPVVLFILVLSFLVSIHELGHFLVAKFFGVHVEEFGLGYPPRAKGLFTWRKTLFSLNWIPFGGFVKLEGEDHPVATPTAFSSQSRLARSLIILAGAGVNFLFGICAFSLAFSFQGIPEQTDQAMIVAVAENSPTFVAQVPVGVVITGFAIAGQTLPTPTLDAVTHISRTYLGQKVTLITTGPCTQTACDLSEHTYSVTIRTAAERPANEGALGLTMSNRVQVRFYPWWQMPFRGAWLGITQSVALGKTIVLGLGDIVWQLIHRTGTPAVAGPVGIYDQAKQAGFLSGDGWALLTFAGLLSINLAVMNVLPLPALDGGRFFFTMLEFVLSRRRVQRVEGTANSLGFVVLVGLIVLVTLRDIWALVQ